MILVSRGLVDKVESVTRNMNHKMKKTSNETDQREKNNIEKLPLHSPSQKAPKCESFVEKVDKGQGIFISVLVMIAFGIIGKKFSKQPIICLISCFDYYATMQQ